MADEPSSENGGDAKEPTSKGSPGARKGDRTAGTSGDALRAAALKAVESEKGAGSERPKAPVKKAPVKKAPVKKASASTEAAVGTLSGKKAAERVEVVDDSHSNRIWIAVGLVVGVLFLAGVALAVLSGGQTEQSEGDAIDTEGRIEVRQITTTSSSTSTTRPSTTTTSQRSTTTTGDDPSPSSTTPTTGGDGGGGGGPVVPPPTPAPDPAALALSAPNPVVVRCGENVTALVLSNNGGSPGAYSVSSGGSVQIVSGGSGTISPGGSVLVVVNAKGSGSLSVSGEGRSLGSRSVSTTPPTC